jgi:hypothetical protein
MDYLNVLKDLYEKESNIKRKNIYETLLKYSNQVKPAEKDKRTLPLFYVKNTQIFFLHYDKEHKLEYVFTDELDILVVLRHLLGEATTIFFDTDIQQKPLSHTYIKDKINEAIQHQDEKAFFFFTSLLQDKNHL